MSLDARLLMKYAKNMKIFARNNKRGDYENNKSRAETKIGPTR